MVAVGKPIIKYLCEDDPKSGYSLVQLIQTSNITAHFMDQDHTAYFDVFSCKEFDPAIVEAIVNKYFSPTNIKSNFLTRQA
jgi:S-adenosylmethionine/arginine decarboxylase-like enzyme